MLTLPPAAARSARGPSPTVQAEYLWRVTKDEAQHTNVDRELIVD